MEDRKRCPVISVVIPVYNVADYLEACVESVLRCKTDNYEVILVDDGSTDGKSGSLCDRLAGAAPERLTVLHQENRGLGGARNTALTKARGSYVLFLDSDDELAEGALACLLEAAEQTHADILEFGFRCLMNGKSVSEYVPQKPWNTLRLIREEQLNPLKNHSACSFLWRREILERSGVRFPEKRWYEDLTFVWKLFRTAETYAAIADVVYLYKLRDGSIMRNTNIKRNGEIMAAIDDVLAFYRDDPQYELFQPALDAMTAAQIYYACYRVLRADPTSSMIDTLLAYLQRTAPDYRHSSDYPLAVSRLQRAVLWCMQHRIRRTPNFMFAMKERMTK